MNSISCVLFTQFLSSSPISAVFEQNSRIVIMTKRRVFQNSKFCLEKVQRKEHFYPRINWLKVVLFTNVLFFNLILRSVSWFLKYR